MKKVVVLGAGMVGSAMAVDLCQEYRVTSVDLDEGTLACLATGYPVTTQKADLSDPAAIAYAVRDADLVIGSVPGFMGFETFKTVIGNKKNIVDISFFNEDPFAVDDLARDNGVVAVMDCGVAPGMSNIILGYHNARMELDYYECLVGGLPVKRTWPYQYKAPFSPIDVLEEYTRPAKLVEGGKIITKEALTDPEYVEFEHVGTLEALNTDGLRTLLKTMKIPTMKEKTLRYPGHIEYMRVLREMGFFGKDPVDVGGVSVRPLDLTAKLMFPKWKLEPDEEEITVMRIVIHGREGGKRKQYTYHLHDRYDQATGVSSMARTTGYTCTAAARLVLEGRYTEKGMSPPEALGAQPGCFEAIMSDQIERGVEYHVEESER